MKSRYWWLLGLAAGIAVILLLPKGEDPNMPVTPEPNVGGMAAMICPFDDLVIRCGSDNDFKDCNNCPEMVRVPFGTFMMETPANAAWDKDAWWPPHEVRIAEPIAVGKFEITFDEWDACVLDRGCSVIPSDEGWGRGRRPVINVSWQDAHEYVRWLSALTSQQLSSFERVRVGVFRTGGIYDEVSVGRHHLHRTGKLRWWRRAWSGGARTMARADSSSR